MVGSAVLQVLILGTILFDIFINSLEEVMEGTLASLQITPNLVGEGRSMVPP